MSDRAVSPINLNPDLSFDAPSPDATHGSNSETEPASISPPDMSPREPKKPARKTPFTVVSVLPECDYKEEWEPKERRTDAYLSVQSELLPRPSAISTASHSELYKPSDARYTAIYQVPSLTTLPASILEYLNVHAADQLTVTQAHFFFSNAGTAPHGPTAKQATELAYFMRSWGFDVYAKLVPEENRLRLYIADRSQGGRKRDRLFWVCIYIFL